MGPFCDCDVQEGPSRLDLPVLVLAGELDASMTPAIMSEIANRIPGARYRELPGAPHMQSLETPDLVTTVLNDFLPA